MYRPPSPHSSSTSSPILAVAMVGIIATAFLLICYYIFVIKCCWTWHRFRHINRGSQRRPRDQPLVDFYSDYTHSHGLDESLIRAIPTIRWKKASQEQAGKGFSECAVCLCEFRVDETLRLLPNCNHGFHIDCIDTWLQSNSNCPLCRSAIAPFQHQYPIFSSYEGDVVIEFINQGSSSAQANSKSKKLEQKSKGDEWIKERRKLEEEFCVQPIRRSFSMDSSNDRESYLRVQRILQKNSQFDLQVIASSSNAGISDSKLKRSVFSLGQIRASKNAILPVEDLA